MPDPCTQRKGISERRADAEDVSLLAYGCAYEKELRLCEIHGLGCFAAVAQSLGFDATRIIIQQRLLRYSSASDYMKKSLSNLEETLRRLINPQQHKLVPRFPPDQNGLLVCRDVFLYLMHVPASTYIQTLLKISDPNAPTRDWYKQLARQLADRGLVAANQIRWLRNKIEQVAHNAVALKDQHGTVTPKAKNTAWQHAGRRGPRPRLSALDQGTPGRLPWPGVPWSQGRAVEPDNNRENMGVGQTAGNSEITAFAEFGVRCVLDCSCPLSSAGSVDFFGASGWAQPSPGAAQPPPPTHPSDFCAVAGRERASGPSRRAKWARKPGCPGVECPGANN
jgi:hypothetical protein